MSNILVKDFYNSNPYPNISNFARVKIPSKFIEKTFNAVNKQVIKDPNILLIGCGTEAPSVFGNEYPNSSIVAIDISEKTLEIARNKCSNRLLTKIDFKCLDLADKNIVNDLDGRTFDYIHCTGVLHHLQEPDRGIKNLSKLLSNDGVIRFQIYSKGARIWIEWARTLFKAKNATNTSEVKEILTALSSYHPFRFTLSTYPESLKESGLKDGFLHPVVNTYYALEWENLFNKYDLEISLWEKVNQIDDVENILPKKLLNDFSNKNIAEKITFLEKIGEWRSDFSGIITKSDLEIQQISFQEVNRKEYIIPSSDSISYPRYHLWNLFKEAIYGLNYNLEKQDIEFILNNLSERCHQTGLKGLLLRLKWSCWKDKCRTYASNALIFKEKKETLIEDYFNNKDKSIFIPSFKSWQWEQWQNGFFAWKW